MDENDLCCEQVELHEDAIRTARQALTDPETVAALADLFKVLGDRRASASCRRCTTRAFASATSPRPWA